MGLPVLSGVWVVFEGAGDDDAGAFDEGCDDVLCGVAPCGGSCPCGDAVVLLVGLLVALAWRGGDVEVDIWGAVAGGLQLWVLGDVAADGDGDGVAQGVLLLWMLIVVMINSIALCAGRCGL